MGLDFNIMNIDMLKEVANIGTGNAATSLSNLINQKIKMGVPTVKMPEFKHLADHIGGADNIIAAILVSVSGDVDGIMMYLMQEPSACALSNKFFGHNRKNFSEFTEMDYSMLTEIGNILTSSYLTSLSQLMGYTINQSIPYLSVDMAQAILSVPAIELGKVADKALFIESAFQQVLEEGAVSDEEEISGFFMLVPEFKDNN